MSEQSINDGFHSAIRPQPKREAEKWRQKDFNAETGKFKTERWGPEYENL